MTPLTPNFGKYFFGTTNPPLPTEVFSQVTTYIQLGEKPTVGLVNKDWNEVYINDQFWREAGAQNYEDFIDRINVLPANLKNLICNQVYSLSFAEEIQKIFQLSFAEKTEWLSREKLIVPQRPSRLSDGKLTCLLSNSGIQALMENLITPYEACRLSDGGLNCLLSNNGLQALRGKLITPYEVGRMSETELKRLFGDMPKDQLMPIPMLPIHSSTNQSLITSSVARSLNNFHQRSRAYASELNKIRQDEPFMRLMGLLFQNCDKLNIANLLKYNGFGGSMSAITLEECCQKNLELVTKIKEVAGDFFEKPGYWGGSYLKNIKAEWLLNICNFGIFEDPKKTVEKIVQLESLLEIPETWSDEEEEQIVEIVSLRGMPKGYLKSTSPCLTNTNLQGADLTGAKLKRFSLHKDSFDRDTHFQDTSITLHILAHDGIWTRGALNINLNHLKNPEEGSLLTHIEQINDKYHDVKINLMHQIIDSLIEKNADTSSVNDALRDIWMKNPIYANDEKISFFIRNMKMSESKISAKNTSLLTQPFTAPHNPTILVSGSKRNNAITTFPNPFSNDEGFSLIKGNPANGIIVLYPQCHSAKGNLEVDYNKEYRNGTFSSQLDIYNDFKLKKPEHIYAESMEKFSAEALNNLSSIEFKHVRKKLEKIRYALESKNKLTPEQLKLFLGLGGATFYAILSQTSDTPATLYATMEDDDDKKMAQIIRNKSYVEDLTPEEKHFVFDQRESQMEKAVMETKEARRGKPAFIVMGEHSCF